VIRACLMRTAELCLVALGVCVLTFLMIHLIPGDAAQVMLGSDDVGAEQVAALRAKLGLDRALPVQFALWLGAAVQGDFGTSIWTGRPVIEEIMGRAGITAELTLLALSLAILLAIPAGCLMASLRSKASDYVIRVVSIAGVTMPSFWLGAMLLLIVSHLLPGVALIGTVPFGDDPAGHFQRLVLPALALALPVLAALSRILRASMLEALAQDYVRTARAKGVAEWRVIAEHALRNALIPFVTSAGIMAGYLFGGSVVVEQVFAIPGLGRLMVGAIAERNYPLVQASILLATLAFVGVNLLVDLLYLAIDPRARA